MSWRAERERAGFCRVFFRDGGDTVLKRNEYEPLCEALRRGDEWYEAEDLYGDPEMIRLSALCRCAEATPAGLVAYDVDQSERADYKKAHGGDT